LDVINASSLIPHPSSFRIAGMDTSDGLADAVLQICRSSGVGAQLQRRHIPLPTGITNWISEEQAIDWALYGGEDFELVLCLPVEIAQALVQQFEEAVIIGEIVEEPIVVLHDQSGQYPDEILSLDKSFQHF
jgi:thiamine-monophosphate kinase